MKRRRKESSIRITHSLHMIPGFRLIRLIDSIYLYRNLYIKQQLAFASPQKPSLSKCTISARMPSHFSQPSSLPLPFSFSPLPFPFRFVHPRLQPPLDPPHLKPHHPPNEGPSEMPLATQKLVLTNPRDVISTRLTCSGTQFVYLERKVLLTLNLHELEEDESNNTPAEEAELSVLWVGEDVECTCCVEWCGTRCVVGTGGRRGGERTPAS
jgi:hypothetical protein